eukprot:CAMPEP_0172299466 /NCGR_PEP_ID=MMETSP1058-20130122/1767_1 /TAXON_ID=83371 /ORGANISM="Detonula confervacea, Strain CCMP 353" /LENGTH=191 /DNA_ID=CAMNT_0013008921 /DNA_START=76 /DNA_END=651 /DNA_ORIENTATION=+
MSTAYWRGDCIAAEEHCHAALTYPTARMPTLLLIYRTFFGGLVAFQLYRHVDGKDDQRLKQGKQMVERLEKLNENSLAMYENKLLMLKAEYCASIGEHNRALSLYKASINAAQDHGSIHDLALAFELLGNYHCSANGDGVDSNECFRKAYVYYIQWGATAMADKLLRKHNLSMEPGTSTELLLGASKNPRE